MIGYLKYVVGNCSSALNELCAINQELRGGMSPESSVDVNRLGLLNKIIQDYIVVRVAGLFDRDNRTISFLTFFPNNPLIKTISEEVIISKIKECRDRSVAHSDLDYIQQEDFVISTLELCHSNLKSILERLKLFLETEDLE